MQNCGIVSLSKMTALNDVSMFTLIHLAKDNGLNLYFCKVEPEELVNVARPAIFHQKDHFVFVEDGEAIPKGEYDGYVLTPRPLHEPLPYSFAKKIRGGKKGGGIISTIVVAIGSLINPILGAALGAGVGAHRASGGAGFDYDAQGEFWRIGTGAVTGATAISNPAVSAMSAAAGEVPRAVRTGDWMAPIGAGLGQYGANVFAGGVGAGLAGVPAGTGILGKVGAGIKGGFVGTPARIGVGAGGAYPGAAPAGVSTFTPATKGILGAGGSLAGGTGASRLAEGAWAPPGVEMARGAGIATTPAGYAGTYTIPGVGSDISRLPGKDSAAMRFASGAATPKPGTTDGFDLSKIMGKVGPTALGMAASTAIAPPKLESNVQENMSKAAQFLGNDNYNALPTATRTQLDEYVNTPLDQLAQKFYAPDDKGLRNLEDKKQKAVDSIMVQYSNYGQDPYTSTEAQSRLTEITREYDQAISEYQQQIQNQAMTEAINFKKDILAKSMEQGEFDYNAAMELATYLGRDQEMKFALESKNYDQLQNVLAGIFLMGK